MSTKITISELGLFDVVVADLKAALIYISDRSNAARVGDWSEWVKENDTYYPYGEICWRRRPWYSDVANLRANRVAGYIVEARYDT